MKNKQEGNGKGRSLSMALSQNSKILIDDINTALSGKIDTAGTGLSKSGTTLALASVVTADNAGPTANATLSYGGTFTVPYITYDAYGRVTGRTNRTMTMPAAPSGGAVQGYVSNTSGALNSYSHSGTINLPSGGTYAIMRTYTRTSGSGANAESDGWIQSYTASGGSKVTGVAIAIRIA